MKLEYKDLNLKDFSIEALGRLIYNTSINLNITLRDELVSVFISKMCDELKKQDYHFMVEQQDGDYLVPRLLINSHVDSVTDVTRIFFILREYLGIKGNLRITDNPYYTNDIGEKDYFERTNNNLTLLLDFTEYKCNSVYDDSEFKLDLNWEWEY